MEVPVKRTCCLIICGVLASSAAEPTSILWHKFGEQAENYLGYGGCGGIDYDNDGLRDVIGVSESFAAGDDTEAGKLYIWSGADQSLLFSKVGEGKQNSLGMGAAPAGRVNGDRIDDFVVTAPGFDGNRGKLYVFAGGTGSLLFSRTGANLRLDPSSGFGRAVASSPGDFNRDGRYDIAVAAPYYGDNAGRIYVFSGVSGRRHFVVTGTTNGTLGWSMAFADVNKDGYSDLVAGEPDYDNHTGRVHVFLGPRGARPSYSPIVGEGGEFGGAVASLGDFDGDGVDDFAVSASGFSGELSAQGRLYVYSGKRGTLIASVVGSANHNLGLKLTAAGDLDGDGLADVAVRVWSLPRQIAVFGGPDLGKGHPIAIIEDPEPNFGANVCGVGDTNGDGYDDLYVAHPVVSSNAGAHTGKIYVMGFDP
jgi:hypothetical protein